MNVKELCKKSEKDLQTIECWNEQYVVVAKYNETLVYEIDSLTLKYRIPLEGWFNNSSSQLIRDQTLYLTRKHEEELRLIAIDLHSGKEIWRTVFSSPPRTNPEVTLYLMQDKLFGWAEEDRFLIEPVDGSLLIHVNDRSRNFKSRTWHDLVIGKEWNKLVIFDNKLERTLLYQGIHDFTCSSTHLYAHEAADYSTKRKYETFFVWNAEMDLIKQFQIHKDLNINKLEYDSVNDLLIGVSATGFLAIDIEKESLSWHEKTYKSDNQDIIFTETNDQFLLFSVLNYGRDDEEFYIRSLKDKSLTALESGNYMSAILLKDKVLIQKPKELILYSISEEL